MWKSKLARGLLSPGDLIRSPAGTVVYYEIASNSLKAARPFIQSYCVRQGGKLRQTTIYAYTSTGEPLTLLRVEVLTPGRPKRKTGRK